MHGVLTLSIPLVLSLSFRDLLLQVAFELHEVMYLFARKIQMSMGPCRSRTSILTIQAYDSVCEHWRHVRPTVDEKRGRGGRWQHGFYSRCYRFFHTKVCFFLFLFLCHSILMLLALVCLLRFSVCACFSLLSLSHLVLSIQQPIYLSIYLFIDPSFCID